MNPLRPNRWATTLIGATGLLLGACVFLAAKIVNPPPIDPLDVAFWDLLGTQAAVLELVNAEGNIAKAATGDQGAVAVIRLAGSS